MKRDATKNHLSVRDYLNFMASFLNILLDTSHDDYIFTILRDCDVCSSVCFQLFQIISTFAEDKLVMFVRDWQLVSNLRLQNYHEQLVLELDIILGDYEEELVI